MSDKPATSDAKDNAAMDRAPIYLDHNATTPIAPAVAAAMEPYLHGLFGNPSSGHIWGRSARAGVDRGREQVAALLQTDPQGVVFTSGGTEANNHAIIGAARRQAANGAAGHIVTSTVEHPAVSEVCRHLEAYGVQTTAVGVDRHGRVDPDAIAAAMRPDTFLVTVMLANNEVGTLQPIAEIAALARSRGILSHTDCAQAVGKVPVRMADLGVDMISLAGHKLYGPKGIGALVLGPGVTLPNLMFGANHEQGRRPGTENVLEIVGLGMACEVAGASLQPEGQRQAALRDRLAAALLAQVPDAVVNGHPRDRLPNTLSISFPGRVAGDILALLPDVALSAGAACHSSGVHVSHVLSAMGIPVSVAVGTIRASVGRMTTVAEIDDAAERIGAAVSAVA
jgi:cysteine desulfurase